ncbi:MAG: PAS domain-containing protein [Candidatus Aenigmarchaeota archaeon]|nr:PAS domain-containing protein [Candidatus Aenigmarchaeota archaeon]
MAKDAVSGIVANLRGEVIAYGKGAENVFGYSQKEIIGKNVAVFHPKGSGKTLERLFRTAMEKGVFEERLTLVRKGGQKFQAILKVTAVRNGKGEITGLAGLTREIRG